MKSSEFFTLLSAFASVLATNLWAPNRFASASLSGCDEKCRYLAPESAGKLERHVPEPADPDDTDPHRRDDAIQTEGRVDRDSSAQQGSGRFRIKRIGNFESEPAVCADTVRKSAALVDAGRLLVRAEVLPPGKAVFARKTCPRLPADADPVVPFQYIDMLALCDYASDDLMSRNEWVGADIPVVVDEMHVAVADTAVRHLDLDLPPADLPGIVIEFLELTPLFHSRITLYVHPQLLDC
jgi:hypothetical protein